MSPSSTALWLRWRRTVRAAPRKTVVIDASSGERFTRAALDKEACRLADGVLNEARARRVALCLPNGFGWLAAFLAIQRQGGAVVPLDAGTPSGALEETARRAGADWLYHGEVIRLGSRRRAAGAACVKLTSGTTGRPKRIACHAAHLLADGRNIARTMGIGPRDRNLGLIPFGHSYGLGNLVLPLIAMGVPVVLAPTFVPRQIPVWIRRHRVTVFPSVPGIFHLLAQLPGDETIAPLRLAVSAAAPLPPATARAFAARFGVRLHNFYGSSESGGICFDRTGESSLRGVALGSPLSGVRVQVLKGGRVRVGSGAVAAPSGSFTLPDRGEWTEAGELRLLGRVSRVVNVGGKKVAPGEIEETLRRLPGVTEAWVTILPHARGAILAAAVESGLAPEAIAAHLSASLPDWKVPRVVKVRALLPRTERGKLDGARLAAWLGS